MVKNWKKKMITSLPHLPLMTMITLLALKREKVIMHLPNNQVVEIVMGAYFSSVMWAFNILYNMIYVMIYEIKSI